MEMGFNMKFHINAFLIVYLLGFPPSHATQVKNSDKKDCANCHKSKNLNEIPKAYQPKREHENIHLKHAAKIHTKFFLRQVICRTSGN